MLARLYGKSNIYRFSIEIFKQIRAFDFLKVIHHDDGDVLAQVLNITRDGDRLIGDCKVIGFKSNKVLKNIRTPFENDALVTIADDEFIKDTIGLTTDDNDYIGLLENHNDLKINLDLKKVITKHIAILAKSGAGKSYTVGVILEEVLKKNIPIVILDPHNEYASIKYPNTNKSDMKRLEKLGLSPLGFLNHVKEFSPDIKINPQCEPISLDLNKLNPQELVNALPQKLSPAQQNLMFNILSSLNNRVNIDELVFHISNEESNSKWSLITLLESLKKLNIYSHTPTPLSEIVRHKRMSIISLKGVEPYVQETFVSGLLRDLFEARKKEEIPPFLLVLEEAHNFCPERSFGEMKSSKIIRTIAGEGRKFGVGLCVISQRPAKVDKNVISQCSTQILLKITNPNDLKSVISSSEGVDNDSEEEIQKLNIGTCLLTGVIDIPLKVNIRPRISKHGGETVDITMSYEVDSSENSNQSSYYKEHMSNDSDDFDDKEETFDIPKQQNRIENNKYYDNVVSAKKEEVTEKEIKSNPEKEHTYKGKYNEFVQFVAPEVELEDAKVLLDTDNVRIGLVSAVMVSLTTPDSKQVNILFDKTNCQIIKNIFPFEGYPVSNELLLLSASESKLLKSILTLEKERFNPAELLLKTDVMYNEILRICDNLFSKKILFKEGKDYVLGNTKFTKNIAESNFYGKQKFEELSYDIKEDEKISNNDVKKIFEMFFKVENLKDIFIVKYIGN